MCVWASFSQHVFWDLAIWFYINDFFPFIAGQHSIIRVTQFDFIYLPVDGKHLYCFHWPLWVKLLWYLYKNEFGTHSKFHIFLASLFPNRLHHSFTDGLRDILLITCTRILGSESVPRRTQSKHHLKQVLLNIMLILKIFPKSLLASRLIAKVKS